MIDRNVHVVGMYSAFFCKYLSVPCCVMYIRNFVSCGAETNLFRRVPHRHPGSTVESLLNDECRCQLRVLAVRKTSPLTRCDAVSESDRHWQAEDMRCISRVRDGSCSSRGGSTGGGVALWVFLDDDMPKHVTLGAAVRRSLPP